MVKWARRSPAQAVAIVAATAFVVALVGALSGQVRLLSRRMAEGQRQGDLRARFADFYARAEAEAAADVNGDGLPDLVVANQGSNDVSVLLGGRDARGRWTFTYRPRLKTGGLGASAVAVLDADGVPDILATNGPSGTVSTIPDTGSHGAGPFNDSAFKAPVVAPESVVQTQVLGPRFGFVLTQPGALLRFDPATGTATDVATGHSVAAFEAVTPAELFTANSDGTVSLLTSEDGEHYAERVVALDPRAGDPSALDAVEACSTST